jgi:hypothetical protein
MIISGVTLSNTVVYDASFNSTGALLYLNAGNPASYSGSGTTWTDLSIYQNDATLTGSPTWTTAGTGSYFSFDGSTQYAPVTSSDMNVPYTGKTTMFLIRTVNANTANATYRALFGNGTGGVRNFNTYMYHVSGTTWQIQFSTGPDFAFWVGPLSASFTVTDNEWIVIAVTQTTSGVLTYYVNGQQIGTPETGVAFSQYIGGASDAVARADNYWSGDMGVCAIYGRALSADEIKQNYNALVLANIYSPVTNNLVLYYDPANTASYPGTGTIINSLASPNLTGTMSNITYTDPYFTYNGTSSQVSVTDTAALEPGSGSWTMEVWVNQTASGNDVVLGKFDPGGLTVDVSYSIRTTGTSYYAQLGSGSGSGSTLFVNSTTFVGTLNTWYQLVYVFTNGGTQTLQTFVNGSSIGTVNHSLTSILNTSSNLYIGSYNNGEFAQWFDGKIGVTRLYNSALTSAQVLQNYNADRSTYGL